MPMTLRLGRSHGSWAMSFGVRGSEERSLSDVSTRFLPARKGHRSGIDQNEAVRRYVGRTPRPEGRTFRIHDPTW